MEPDEAAKCFEAAAPVLRDAYADLAAPPLRQLGKLGDDLMKAIRLLFAPVQLAAAYQDRLENYLNIAVKNVPPERRIVPPEALLMPILEKLRYRACHEPITTLYINLLSRAMDGERIGEAHPAFFGVISDLAPDEATFLRLLSMYPCRAFVKINNDNPTPTADEVQAVFSKLTLSNTHLALVRTWLFPYHELNQPEMFYLFLEHLYHLGLIEYTNGENGLDELRGARTNVPGRGSAGVYFVKLTAFGALFHRACVANGEPE